MKYAPVFIPTLNRFDHLKQCVDSLSMNHNADKTEVYISVDYPPSEKYREGYEKICHYLDSGGFNFKKLHVIKQTENLGVINNGTKKYSNALFLEDIAVHNYDRWIITEDDNVFAPGFLDFMNEALEKFKDDKTVFSVCGYRFYYNLKFDGNNFFRQNADFNGWGCGFWRDKYALVRTLEVDYLRRIVYNPFKVLKYWRVSNKQVSNLAGFSRKTNFKKQDNFDTLYMIDQDMTQIMPTKSFVRNIGWDELGLHCLGFSDDVVNKFMKQEIDDSPSFDGLKGTGWEFFGENQKIIRDEDFQKVSFGHAFRAYIKRLMVFWK